MSDGCIFNTVDIYVHNMRWKKRIYDKCYVEYGFTTIHFNRELNSQCIICSKVLMDETYEICKKLPLKRQEQTFFWMQFKYAKKMQLRATGTFLVVSWRFLISCFRNIKTK